MVRLISLLCLFLIPCWIQAQPSPETDARVGKALAIQQAINSARENLRAGKPADAVAVLEAEILYVNGNSNFLALMKEAYLASLKDLQQKNAAPEKLEHIRRQLRILDPKITFEVAPAEAVKPVAMPEPTKPAPVVDPLKPVEDPVEVPPPMAKPQPKAAIDDPFQQTPLDRQPAGDLKARASAAFTQKHYSEAAELFEKARQAKLELTVEERQAFAYCRLHDVVSRLNNKGNGPAPSLPNLERQAQEAAQMGGPALAQFADQVLTAIRQRKTSAGPAETIALPEGWQALEAGSFRVIYQQAQPQAQQAAQVAEQIRKTTFEKWSGPAGGDWSPRCDVWLHTTAADYAKATGKPAASPGHASIGMSGGKVQNRRIDLRCDDAGMLDVTLPREVAYTVLADLFPDQPLPRWADVGITMLATPEAEVARYRRAVPKFVQDRKLFAMRDLLKMADFPEAERITPFYVASVSLVDYLVRLKGEKAFALYLREAPRRGYEEALQRHYGIKDASDLQERWLRSALGAE